jgi:hypothetical protein
VRDSPWDPLAEDRSFGCLELASRKTILASGHTDTDRINRPDIWMQAIRSDQKTSCATGGRPHMGPGVRREDIFSERAFAHPHSPIQFSNSLDTTSRSRRPHAPSSTLNIPPPEIRGRRECRARDAPAVSYAIKKQAYEHSHHGHAGSPGIPRAMVLTGSFVLSPAIGLVCHRRQRSCLH